MRVALVIVLLSTAAFAERLLVCGYELQSTRAGIETDPGDVLGSTFIDASPVHGGSAVARAVAVAGRRSSFAHYFVSSTPAMYARVYVRLEQPVNATTMFLLLRRSSAVPAISWLTLDAQGDVRARVWVSDYGPIARLTLGQWHRFDLFVDERPASGSHLVQIAMDGQPILLVQGLALSHIVDQLEVGLNVNAEMASSGVMLFDDVAVNGTAGPEENGFPMPGQVFLMQPNGPAGTPAWTPNDGGVATMENWRAVSELPPDDAASALESRTNTRVVDEFEVSAPPPLAASTPASLVMVGLRFSGDGTTNRSVGVGLRAGATGTLQQSPALSAAVTTWYSNRVDGYLNVPLSASRTPEGTPWTGLALDELRVAIVDADSVARPLRVTSAWAFAEFPMASEPRPPIPGTGPVAGLDGGSSPDAGSDAGVDAGAAGDGGPDSGAGSDADGGAADSGPDDAGSEDDAGSGDAGQGTGQQDDGGVGADPGLPPGPHSYIVGCACSGASGSSVVALSLLLLLWAARRRA